MARSIDLEFVFKCFFEGVLFSQLVYVILHLLAHKTRRDYLYYLLFLSCSILYFIYKDFMLYGMGWAYGHYPYPHNGLNYILANLMHLTYLKFVKHFIGSKVKYPQIHRLATRLKWFIASFILLNVLSLSVSGSLVAPFLQYAYSAVTAFLAFMLLRLALRHYNRLIGYVLIGSLSYALSAVLSLVLAVLHQQGYLPSFTGSLTVMQVGCMVEVLCFTAGLAHKSLLVEQERNAAKESLLRQMEHNRELDDNLQQVRNRISADLHDDVGGTLTAISVYSDVAQRYQQRGNTRGVTDMLLQISGTARQMMADMQDIIWMVSPKNDQAESLFGRIHGFASSVLSGKQVQLHFSLDEALKTMPLDMQLRRDIYLLAKEGVNNAVKHSGCGNLWLSFSHVEGEIRMLIKDDGTGIKGKGTGGNGMANLMKRTRTHRGKFTIESDGAGTALFFSLPTKALTA